MLDLEEQEKVDALKSWWDDHRVSVIAIFVAGLAAYGGFTGWNAWKARQAEQAAQQFAAFEKAAGSGDADKVLAAAKVIEEAVPGSPFSARAALTCSQRLQAAGKTADAQTQLRWVIDHARETQLQTIARLRLSGLLADAQKYPEALELLDSGTDPAFASMVADRKGDILLAQGKTADARTSYQAALKAADEGQALRGLVQAKLDALGAGQ